MPRSPFPPLQLADWRTTRDTLHGYAKVLGAIRRALSPRQRHWWHVTLQVETRGLATPPIPHPDGDRAFSLRLDFLSHSVVVETSRGEGWERPFDGVPSRVFAREVLGALADLGISTGLDAGELGDPSAGRWDQVAVDRYWQALVPISLRFEAFKGEQRQETSPVELYPHHFDLALSWFSGRLVPGEDPSDEERADEQMTFGFSTGDRSIPVPYFYATAYPRPDGFVGAALPSGAGWHEHGFLGAALPYHCLTETTDPVALLDDFLRAALRAGRAAMGLGTENASRRVGE